MEQLKENIQRKSFEEKLIAVRAALDNTYMFDPKKMLNALQLQGNEVIKNCSKELQNKIYIESKKSIFKIAEIVNKDVENHTAGTHPKVLAEIIWSLFTGTVLTKGNIRLMNREKFESIFKELKMAVLFLLNGFEGNLIGPYLYEAIG